MKFAESGKERRVIVKGDGTATYHGTPYNLTHNDEDGQHDESPPVF